MHVAQSARALFENSLLLGSTGFPRGTPDSAPVPLTQPFSFNGAMSICFTPYTPSIARGEPCAGRSQPLRCTGSTEAVRPMTNDFRLLTNDRRPLLDVSNCDPFYGH